MQLDVGHVTRRLETLNGHGLKDVRITEMAVCGHAEPRGALTEDEYAPYLAAADATHTHYMTWSRTIRAPECLRATVSVNQTVVAWIQYDGIARVIDRPFSMPLMNTVRDLARKHLGQAPEVQQLLADQRADIDAMSADGFARAIGTFRARAAAGSKMNDYPPGVSAREWDHANRVQNTGDDRQHRPWIYPANPTRELTDEERAYWRGEADRYTEAFRARFPDEHRFWEFRNWWETNRAERADGPPLSLKADERILIEFTGILTPAVVAWPMKRSADEVVDVLVQPGQHGADSDGLMTWVRIYPGRVLRYEDVPEDIRARWETTWAELLERLKAKYSDPAFDAVRYDN